MAEDVYIADTSSLVALERLDAWFLFEMLFGKVVIVREVAVEYGKRLPKWIEVRELSYQAMLEKQKMKLDSGEAATIAVALETADCTVIIDEAQGRKEATRRGLQVIGMLGVLLRAKNAGLIHSVADYIERLKEAGFRMSDVLATNILHLAGEKT